MPPSCVLQRAIEPRHVKFVRWRCLLGGLVFPLVFPSQSRRPLPVARDPVAISPDPFAAATPHEKTRRLKNASSSSIFHPTSPDSDGLHRCPPLCAQPARPQLAPLDLSHPPAFRSAACDGGLRALATKPRLFPSAPFLIMHGRIQVHPVTQSEQRWGRGRGRPGRRGGTGRETHRHLGLSARAVAEANRIGVPGARSRAARCWRDSGRGARPQTGPSPVASPVSPSLHSLWPQPPVAMRNTC